MRFTTVVLGIFASVVLAAPIPDAKADPQLEISGPLGSASWGGLRNGGGAEFSGPLGSLSIPALGERPGFSLDSPLGSISIGDWKNKKTKKN